MAVSVFFLLSSVGLVITAQAQNCPSPVLGPNMSLKGESILLQTFPDGTRVSLSCDPGYQSAGGSTSITCTAGKWSSVTLKCEKKSCGALEQVQNGQVDYPDGIEFGAKAVITCNPGYIMVGNSEIRCEAQGWGGRLPTCEVVKCPSLPQISSGSFSPDKEEYEYAEAVIYTCMKDYTLNGSKSVSCSEDGTFKPASPNCVKVQCPDINIENGDFVSGSRPPHGYQASVTFKCREGYDMMGSSGTLTCAMNSTWIPGIPTCKKKPTTTATTTTTTATTTTTTTTPRTTKRPTGSGSGSGSGSGTADKENDGTSTNSGLIIGLVFCGLLIVGAVLFGFYWKKKKGSEEDKTDAAQHGEAVPLEAKQA